MGFKKNIAISLFTFISLLSSPIISGQNITKEVHSSEKDKKTQSSDDILELEFDENISHPKIGNNQKAIIQAFQQAQAKRLDDFAQKQNKDCVHVELMRNKEVIVVTIGSDCLFAPNATTLSPTADAYLQPFMPFFKTPDLYKILLVMHSDDTGSQEYTLWLTEMRVNAIYDWFEHAQLDISTLVPYAMGDSDPLLPNNSRKNRQKNRRLEIYLVPGSAMISKAKAGTLR